MQRDFQAEAKVFKALCDPKRLAILEQLRSGEKCACVLLEPMDLTQSVFIAVLRALPGYRAERASFRTWLYRIAANKVIDTRRKARPVSIPIQEMELPAAEDFVARVHDRALLETIEGYVSGLDPGEQAVFRLRIYGEKTFPEIAAAMGEPEAAVKSRYYRLIGRLRKEFGADG